jgi:hypothetical protein
MTVVKVATASSWIWKLENVEVQSLWSENGEKSRAT